jgi:hypothetical protein
VKTVGEGRIQEGHLVIKKMLKVDWSNMQCWIMIYDPLVAELEKSIVCSISEHEIGTGDEPDGHNKLYKLVEAINLKYNNRVRVYSYVKTDDCLKLKYEDDTYIKYIRKTGALIIR